MRKVVPVFFGLGGFLLVAGLVAMIWGPGLAERTPLNTNTLTKLSGTATVLDASAGKSSEHRVVASSVNTIDSRHSTGTVAAWTSSACLLIDQDNAPTAKCLRSSDSRLLSSSTDVFATDRHNGLSVSSSSLPSSATPHSGLVNKFPFNAKKKTYPFWDGTAGKAVPAAYVGTKKIDGLTTYYYRTSVKDVAIELGPGIKGIYDDVTGIYVDPRTGAIINQTDDQQRYLTDKTPALDLHLAFTPAQQKTNVDQASHNRTMLSVVTVIFPIIGIAVGLLLLGLGVRSLRRGTQAPTMPRQRSAEPLAATRHDTEKDAEPVTSGDGPGR